MFLCSGSFHQPRGQLKQPKHRAKRCIEIQRTSKLLSSATSKRGVCKVAPYNLETTVYSVEVFGNCNVNEACFGCSTPFATIFIQRSTSEGKCILQHTSRIQVSLVQKICNRKKQGLSH